MKKYKIFLFFTLLVLILTSSCSQDSISQIESQELKVFEPIESIINDEVFISLVERSIILAENIKDIELLKKLLAEGEEMSDLEKTNFANNIGFDSFEGVNSYFVKQTKTIDYLNERYNLQSYSQDDISQIALKGLYFSENIEIQRVGGDCNCERLRRNCLFQAFAGAILGHIGCATVDAIGIGILCHAAVLTLQAVVSDSCNADWENCVLGCSIE